MNDKQRIIDTLHEALKPLGYVHAFWLEGSDASGHADEFSDIDAWISVDDEMLKAAFEDVERALEKLERIDFKYVMKTEGELGHNVYHVSGMSKFLTLDMNTQKLSRDIVLTDGIDEHAVIFDKSGVIKTKKRDEYEFDRDVGLKRMIDYAEYMSLSVEKNIKRGKILEASTYYQAILAYIVRYFRLEAGLSEKVDFGFKHVYRELQPDTVKRLEYFYFVSPDNLQDRMDELKQWIGKL